MKYWSKTILTVYNYLEEMSDTIEKIVTETAIRSNNRSLMDYQTTMYQANKIIELTERKRKVINLKVIIDKCLSRISGTDKFILKLAYMEGIKSEFIAQILNISLRSYFRLKMKALENFKQQLNELRYGIKFFKLEYETENWISAIYNECVSKSLVGNDAIDSAIIRYAIRQLPAIELYKKVGSF